MQFLAISSKFSAAPQVDPIWETLLLDHSSFLLKWSVEILQTGDEELPTKQAMHPHENGPSFKATFKKHKNTLTELAKAFRKAFTDDEITFRKVFANSYF